VALNLGTALITTGAISEAITVLQSSIDRYPDQPNLTEVFLKLGYASAKHGECEQAISSFGRAVAGSDPEIAVEAQFRIGECYAELEERDKAIVEYLKVIYLYPSYLSWVSAAQFRAANIYEDLDKEEEALKLYQKVIDTSGDEALTEKARKRIESLTQELPQKNK